MQQVQLSYRSVEASVTYVQYQSSRQDLAVRLNKPSQNQDLNPQQRQIIDDVGISQEAVLKLREAQELANQLQNYLDYLNGNARELGIEITPSEGRGDIEISGQSTDLAASITVARYKETSIDVMAQYNDEGDLQSLSVQKSSMSTQYVKVSAIMENSQFSLRA